MAGIADRLESAADEVTTVERGLAVHGASPGTFAADRYGGVPGRVGAQLHELWTTTLDSRSRDARDLSRRLAGLAADVRTTTRAYEETDDEAARRINRYAREA
ncbi:type VII secretion target [Actinoplanes sp. N902-109]|uniref:type VII secretion target n=1 Tax=Actinoplanes sp. (strain N902-109) TaxID=649831 RepID=UPI0003295E1A|nr:type VII secretion target [Actinoplanes sp. N902-109]AGL13983.1 hypothetical protein L083_0473 [Actinoplanes sp. N902-109]